MISSAALVSVLAAPQASQAQLPKVYGYEVVHEYDHDPGAFTQGLEHERKCQPPNKNGRVSCTDILWESTGTPGLLACLPGVMRLVVCRSCAQSKACLLACMFACESCDDSSYAAVRCLLWPRMEHPHRAACAGCICIQLPSMAVQCTRLDCQLACPIRPASTTSEICLSQSCWRLACNSSLAFLNDTAAQS